MEPKLHMHIRKEDLERAQKCNMLVQVSVQVFFNDKEISLEEVAQQFSEALDTLSGNKCYVTITDTQIAEGFFVNPDGN